MVKIREIDADTDGSTCQTDARGFHKVLIVLTTQAVDEEGDPGIIISDDNTVFITGHLEYDTNTLANEYARDVGKGIEPAFPLNYYPGDDARYDPILSWRSYSTLIFTNWLNYYVYQQTPYDLRKIKEKK